MILIFLALLALAAALTLRLEWHIAELQRIQTRSDSRKPVMPAGSSMFDNASPIIAKP